MTERYLIFHLPFLIHFLPQQKVQHTGMRNDENTTFSLEIKLPYIIENDGFQFIDAHVKLVIGFSFVIF